MKFFNPELEAKIKAAPELPGCYIYRSQEGVVIYVGKALVLRERVKQYFDGNHILGMRISNMVNLIRDVEFVIADSETEALILETNLIKKYRPKYNVLKKDDKNYQWLMFPKREDFTKPILTRDTNNKTAEYFGPFNNSLPLKRTLKLLRHIFPYRTCTRKIVQLKNQSPAIGAQVAVSSSDPKPCLYYFLGLCPAPCAGFISKEDYGKNIKAIKRFFDNDKVSMIKEMRQEMYELAQKKEFEQAAAMRDRINDLVAISHKIDVAQDTDEHKFRRLKDANKALALSELLDIIEVENLELKRDFKMECYDISNISGTNAVGSMVVFVDGLPAKRLYRKFKIRGKNTPDDFAMLKQVFTRRFGRFAETAQTELIESPKKANPAKPDASFDTPPDLIIVDGGKGQLSSVFKVLLELRVKIPVIGLAKRFEDIYAVKEDAGGELVFTRKTLPIGSQARFLMQRIRDEAHRFGITFHRQLRLKAQKFSVLNEIPGVGATIGSRLLKAFGSIDGIRKASEADLENVVRNKKTIQKIKAVLGV